VCSVAGQPGNEKALPRSSVPSRSSKTNLPFLKGAKRVLFQSSPRRSVWDAKTALTARPKRVSPHGRENQVEIEMTAVRWGGREEAKREANEERFLTSAGRPVARGTGTKKSACSVRIDERGVGVGPATVPVLKSCHDPSAPVGMTEKSGSKDPPLQGRKRRRGQERARCIVPLQPAK
jgi:hypothetical protein